ncbi:class I SAM-dependent methyltransferase [Mycobacterium riyadhense]|uniref:class I SAM-dependent methyltransferase n=1 Tax=Mycobacterium riyadhense TaxID=486698 RepID=UPI0019505719|nr:class I SAM-dependent methyltransferase [Mycobacterium riyadhense]
MPHSDVIADARLLANDGSVLEILRRQPATGEVDVIRDLLRPNCSVLDLGAGVGRIANPLVEHGYQVTAVDDCADLLAEVRGARTICARIEELRLPEKYDGVLLATNLINYPGIDLRRGVLATVAQHLKPTGKAIIQWRPPLWFASSRLGRTYRRVEGPRVLTRTFHTDRGGIVEGELTWECDGQMWKQPFRFERIAGDDLRRELDCAGLKSDTSDLESTEWLEVSHRRP